MESRILESTRSYCGWTTMLYLCVWNTFLFLAPLGGTYCFYIKKKSILNNQIIDFVINEPSSIKIYSLVLYMKISIVI